MDGQWCLELRSTVDPWRQRAMHVPVMIISTYRKRGDTFAERGYNRSSNMAKGCGFPCQSLLLLLCSPSKERELAVPPYGMLLHLVCVALHFFSCVEGILVVRYTYTHARFGDVKKKNKSRVTSHAERKYQRDIDADATAGCI